MSRAQHVEIQKGELRGRVLPRSLPTWEANGWTRVDDGSSEPEPSGDTTPVVETPLPQLFGAKADDEKEEE